MKNSIRTKLILLILIALMMTAGIMGVVSFYATNEITKQYSDKYITAICEKNAVEINSLLKRVKQTVDSLKMQVDEKLSNPMNLADSVYCENFTEMMKSDILNSANNTDGAIAVYLRYNPEFTTPTAGLFMTRDSNESEMKNIPTTDLSKYDENDVEYVGWYYGPIKEGKAIWTDPYYNKNIDVYMISYIIPIFKDDITVGVIGMDVNFDYIKESVSEIQVYESGYAYLTTEDSTIIYHPSLQEGYELKEKKDWKIYNTSLDNGMVLSLTAPISEINAAQNELIKKIIVISVVLLSVFIIVTTLITRRMITPLQKLNSVAIKIADGDYDVDFSFKRPKDEIGQLTDSFEKTAGNLKKYMEYINGLAYKDSLTGIRNKTAYDNEKMLLEKEIRGEHSKPFAIVVFDVNNLKKINDSLGHEMGNLLLKGACNIICKAFSHCAIFRIGGDEFVAIVRGESLENIDRIYEKFKALMEETKDDENPAKRISIACGWAVYDRAEDFYSVESVFKRADAKMYANKCEMKAKNGEKPR